MPVVWDVSLNIRQLRSWGYKSITEVREQVTNMRAANIPLEGMPMVLISLLI